MKLIGAEDCLRSEHYTKSLRKKCKQKFRESFPNLTRFSSSNVFPTTLFSHMWFQILHFRKIATNCT